MPRVLVVDDDRTVAEVVVAYLERAGIDAAHAADGPAALASATATRPDAVVLDLMLPGIDGLEVCRRLRADRPHLPVLMLTARGEEEDRVLGLETGADDYVTKPFSARELTLRVQAVLRRAGLDVERPASGEGTLRDGDLLLDARAHRVLRDDQDLSLTSREFDLLHWFLHHPGQVFDRSGLMREVWGWEFGDQSTVTVHVRRLREKVESDPSSPQRLVTVFGVGYRWDRREPPTSSWTG